MTSASRTTETHTTAHAGSSELNHVPERVRDLPPTPRRELDERTGEG